ncbi:ATPase PAAT [Spea bombifrons]|uniref:ATPase PAAT n=1 Tax=Spea bombifrons TaxID=233779 RepID=UPI00234AAF23|nr:ATPase PAAT [Spea bombifrons]
MSGPMSSDLGGYHQVPVTCASTWQCDGELCSVLNASYSENSHEKEEDTSRECCVYLEPAASIEAGTPCSLFLSAIGPEKNRIRSVSVCSQARTIEVYNVSSDGKEEEYLGSCRGERLCTLPSKHGEESPVVLYKTYLKLDFPISSCKVKLLSLAGKLCVALNKISVEMTLVPEKYSQPSFGLGPSINLDRVQSIVDSMGGKMSPGAEQLMSMVRAQQKHQIPFGPHLLQLFGNFDHSTEGVQRNKRLGTQIPPVNKVSEMLLNQTRDFQLPSEALASVQSAVPPNNDLKTAVCSFLQTPANGITGASNSDSLIPLLRNLCVEQNQSLREQTQGRQEAQETRKGAAALEKLVSLHMERMEKTLIQHVDQKMKDLQEHLDARLDGLISVIQNSNSLSPGRAGLKHVNGQIDHSGKQNGDYTALSNHHIADALS